MDILSTTIAICIEVLIYLLYFTHKFKNNAYLIYLILWSLIFWVWAIPNIITTKKFDLDVITFLLIIIISILMLLLMENFYSTCNIMCFSCIKLYTGPHKLIVNLIPKEKA